MILALRTQLRMARNVLGPQPPTTLAIQHRRYTFISHALAEVRDAAGHANAMVTSGYLHVSENKVSIGRLFA